jgi:hypothetical protein
MRIFSVEYRMGRSSVIRREWFQTEAAAERWMSEPAKGERDLVGPLTHIVHGKKGVVSILTTYAS